MQLTNGGMFAPTESADELKLAEEIEAAQTLQVKMAAWERYAEHLDKHHERMQYLLDAHLKGNPTLEERADYQQLLRG